jgi:hypothetical protein
MTRAAGEHMQEFGQELRARIEDLRAAHQAERSKQELSGTPGANTVWQKADAVREALAEYRRTFGAAPLAGEDAHFPDHLTADANDFRPDPEAGPCPECGAMSPPGQDCWYCPRETPRAGLVLGCGGREFQDYRMVRMTLDSLAPAGIVHGAARGADTLVGRYARDRALPCREFPVNWYPEGKFHRGAAFDRNKRMLLTSRPDLVVAFPGRGGTAHMVRTAREHGYRVQMAG